MKKKRMVILLILLLVMIISIGAISAADTNDTSLGAVSDTDIATTSVAVEQEDNATSFYNDDGINVNDDNQKEGGASSNLGNDVLSVSDDDLLGENPNFYYRGKWYGDLDDAVDDAEDYGGTIYLRGNAWGYDSAERRISIDTGVSITFEPYSSSDTVIFDGQNQEHWFFVLNDNNAYVTFNRITFRNGGDSFQGGAIEVDEGHLILNDCTFDNNIALTNLAGGFGWGGAIYLDSDECTLIANNCKFINNEARGGGGAVCIQGDGSTATFNNCYFSDNTAPKGNDVYDKDGGSHTFSNCVFKGSGSIDFEVDAPEKSVTITPKDVADDANYAVLYKNGVEYDRTPCNDWDTVTFDHLESGTYTIYMAKGWEKRYEYSGTTFTIIEPYFVLTVGETVNVFETLSAAVNAIPNGGTGVITVENGITFTNSANFNVDIINKVVTIMPKDITDGADPVIFSGNSQNYLLYASSNSQLTMSGITITGKFSDSALKFLTDKECTISDCEFKNIQQLVCPIFAQNSNLVLNGNTFESTSRIVLGNTVVKIDDCTFTSNEGINGGAIYANSYSDVTITNSEFSYNKGTGYGGAIYASNLKIHDTTFIGNSANLGGAVYIASGSSELVNITGCVFDSNVATNYRNIFSESPTRNFNLQYNEYDLNLTISPKDGAYGMEYVLDGGFDWGSNLNNNYTLLAGVMDETIFGELLTIEDNQFKINLGVLSGGTHEFTMAGMYTQGDSNDHFYLHEYYSDLYGNEFYLIKEAYAKILIEKAKINLNLSVDNVLIPETPVLNVRANWDNNYTIIIGNKNYQLEVVNGKASMQLTGLDLGNYTVVGMRDGDENYYFVMNFTTFSVSKTYSNFLVLSTNVEYDTLAEAVANSNYEDIIYIKKGTYKDTGVVISNKTLDITALEGAIFDADGRDANFIIVNENAVVDISGITFRGLHNRNTNYGAIVNHGYLSVTSCNFTDNKITKTTFAENGGAAIFSDGHSLAIDSCNFINNVAPLKVSTAAVTSLGYDEISIIDSKFINNSAREGGALHFKNIIQFEDTVTSCEFEHNTAVKGSAIYVGNNSGYISVTLSDFKKNDIKNSLGEKTQLEGGVIYVNANGVIMDISLSNFEDNANSNVDGGVICLDGSSKASIESCIFNNNSGKVGSVILIKNPYDKKLTLIIDGSAFTNNNAATGAIATSPKVTALIDECVFANNTGENRHIHSNGFTVVHDSIFDVKDAKLNAPSVHYGESSIISGTADIGTNIYAAANLTVVGENNIVEIKNNSFTYNAGILNHGKYYAVLNNIADNNNNTYLMDSITEIFRVTRDSIDMNVSVDNITYGETLKVVESIPSNATGTLVYQLNGKYYTKDEIESLILDAGKYTLVAIYDHEDFAFTSTTVNFEVYKANPTIYVPNVDVKYNDSIVLYIESDVASIYTIEIEDYKNVVFVNGSRTIVIDKTLNPGNYTIKVTSQERVNYISNSTEANLNVNENLPVFGLRILNTNMDDIGTDNSGENDSLVDTSNKVQAKPLLAIMYFAVEDTESDENLGDSPDNDLGEEYWEGKFLFQYDEDDDYEYFDTLEDAIDEAVLYGAGIITVRGGTYSGYGFSGIVIEGEAEITIKAYEGEEVIFDCENQDFFLHLTYETEVEPISTPPFFEIYQTGGPTLTIDNITVINGYAVHGGAIDIDAGTLILANCTFSNNNADYGGAIYIGSVTADEDAMVIGYNTTFTNNYASDEGGAVYIASGMQDTSASFYLCTFLYNYHGEDEDKKINYFAGGNADEITTQYCIFNANGTIYSVDMDKINQTVTVNGTSTDIFDSVVLMYFDMVPIYTINNNGSKSFNVTFEDVMGGNYTVGVMDNHNFNIYVFEDRFEMRVPNFIISEDEVYENLTDAIDAVAENGIIYANMNYYTEDNMEIDIGKSFTLKNFRGRDVVFDGCGERWFFTIAEGCTVVFDGIYFTDGAVKNNASIENYGTLIINNCTFDSFETNEIIHNSGLLNILNSTFTLNSVNNAVVWNDADLVIKATEFSYNIVNTSSTVYTDWAAEIVSSNFTGNYNFGNGGAIYNSNFLIVNGTVFSENEGFDGGAVYNEGTLEVINSTFEDNTANGYGGAIYNGNEANISNSTFTGSSSEKDGGAIYNNNIMVVDNSTFVGNTATGRGGAIYNKKSLVLTKSLFGINFAEEYANIYNEGDIQFSGNIFDFYDVILVIPDGEYGIPTTITGTLNPEFNMDLQTVLPGFVNGKDATVTISDGVFEYVTDILPKGIYDVKLDEIIYDVYGNIYYGELITDRLIINKANVYINVTVDDVVIRGESESPVLKIDTSKTGLFRILFNNRLFDVNITEEHTSITLDAVGEGNYSVTVIREGDENYKDAVNTTSFKVSKYEGNFIVNSTGNEFDTLSEAIADTSNDDVIYVREGTYSGWKNTGLTISDKKLTIISLGDVVFDGESTGSFIEVTENADLTICDVVITGFRTYSFWFNRLYSTFENYGNLTLDGCTIVNNTVPGGVGKALMVYNEGNLNIVGSEFYDNTLDGGNFINCQPQSTLIINESTFENNTLNKEFLLIDSANSVKIISTVFAENDISSQNVRFIDARYSEVDIISSEFYNNTLKSSLIYAGVTDLLVNNSIFSGNDVTNIICSESNTKNTIISGCVFTENTVQNVVLSYTKNLLVLESTFSDNTLSGNGALNIASIENGIINGSVFTNNKANGYRNVYTRSSNLIIINSVFDALNVDYTVHDIDYGQNETIEGTADFGTNYIFAVNLDINSNTYSVNVTDGKFTYNAGILNGGEYIVVLNPKDANSNTFVFDKITKVFTVSRVDPGLSVSIEDITQGEKLKVNSTIDKKAKGNVVYELNGNVYSKAQLENLTLTPGNYLVTAVYRGDKNYLPASEMVNVKVNKIAPNITVNDVAVNYGDEIKINVTVDVADYYTVFLDNRYNESVTLYVENSAIFTFPSESFKAGSYEITVYVFESDDYAEAYGYATLTVNKATGFFKLSNDLIIEGENATVTVEVPANAYGDIAYKVYNSKDELVYSITQSCLEDLIVPDLKGGRYIVMGTFEGDSYYDSSSKVSSAVIFVRGYVDVNLTVDNITYGENAIVTVESTVDGDYLVHVGTEPVVVTVIGGTGNVSVPNLSVGSYAVNVTAVNGNYFAFDETVFDVAIKSVSVAVSVEDIVFGEKAIVMVNGEVDGEYIVEIYGQDYTVNVVNGKGNTAIDGLATGKDILVSVTIADGNYSAYNTTTFNVENKYNTTISLDVVTDENNVAMTVTVDDAATGLVRFQVNGATEYTIYTDVINGKAVLEDVLDAGDYTVIVTYMGDGRFNTNITYGEFTIRGHIKKDTPIAAYADVVGNRVTMTVIVNENATGFVKLSVGGTVANIELVDGVAKLTTILVPNSYYVDVTYLGDDNYNMNSTKLTFTVAEVSKENTTIDLNIIAYEDAALIMVDLNETATGLVKFYMICKETGENYTMYMDVIGGHVETFTNSIEPGNYTVTATYMGDSVFNTNTTSKDVEILGHLMKDTPIIANVVANGNRVTLTVNVDENATGFVELKFGDNVFNIALEEGIGTLTTTLPYGSYSLDITYLGDDNYNKNSTKCDFTLVEPAKENTPISIDIVSDENYVWMTVTVSDAATGLVKFQVTGEEEYVVYADVVDGKAVLEDVLVAGDYTVVATYMGDNRFNTNITYKDFNILGHIKKDTPIAAYADVVGNRVTMTVIVNENATGFVKLSVGGTVANIELVDGVGTLAITLPANSYYVDVTYLGDDDFNMNSTKVTFTVTEPSKKNTIIDLDVTVDENSVLFDVGLNAAATGFVKFYIINKENGENFTGYMDVKEGYAGLLVNGIEPGNYTVTATYMGDSVFNTNATSRDFEVIGHVMKDTPIDVNVETNANKVTLTVNVDENATGFVEVKFSDSVFNIALENGEGTLTTTLPYGSYSLDITYLGDDNYNENFTKCDFTLVEPAKENTPISVDIFTDENYVMMTVTVSDAATGLVKFQVTGEEEYVVYADVVDGIAVLEDVLDAGDYSVVATYMGDNRFNTNITYGDFTILGHIKKDTPIAAYADVVGNRVTMTVIVNENATGFVKLSVGGTVANIELVDGVGTLAITLPANSYYVDVTYLGDDDYNMNSTKVTFTIAEVSKENTTIDLNIIAYEDAALIMVDLNESATGLVKFYMICKETGENYTMYMDVIDGHVETFTNSIEPGNYTVTATYMGDSVFNTNTTSKDVEILGHLMKDTPIIANVVANGNRVTLTVNVDENATGFVEVKFSDSVFIIALTDGTGTLTTTLPYGSYSLDITYLGDDDFNMNSTKVTFTVTEPSKKNTVIDLNVTVDENTVIFGVGLNEAATGFVKFYIMNKETGENYTRYMDVKDGRVEMLVKGIEPGNYTVTATYMGDSVFNTNTTSEDFEIPLPEDANVTVDVNGSVVSVELPKDAEGYVVISVDGKKYYFDADEEIELDLSDLAPDNYTVEVAYSGDDKYAPATVNATVTVPEVVPEDANLTVTVQNTTIVVSVAENATGNILVDVNGTGYFAPIENGHATVEVIGLDEGIYDAVVTYSGDESYAPANVTVAVTVPPAPKNETDVDPKANITVSEDAIIMELPEDATGYMLLDVEGTGYYVPVDNGTAIFKLPKLAIGNHTVDITYTGDKKYVSANFTETIEIPYPEETIFADDLVKVEKAADSFVANFTDIEGNPLANTNITFKINGIEYTRTTDANGHASIAIGLPSGNYTITSSNPVTGDVKVNNITVLSRFTEDGDLVKYFRNDSQYVLRVLADDGNPIGANEAVTFNINGVFYTRTTNATGHVKLDINLPPGTYIITAEYKGAKVAHSVTVLPILTADNLSKKFGDPTQFEAHVFDGQGNPIGGQKVEFNINGVFYYRISDSNGIAKLDINLRPGEYIITSVYGPAALSNTITVTA